ncbi:MAG TPA: hypothetical protein VF060_14930 [Trebonia sp.]
MSNQLNGNVYWWDGWDWDTAGCGQMPGWVRRGWGGVDAGTGPVAGAADGGRGGGWRAVGV